MNKERWLSLELGNHADGPQLTKEEINQGWHFCIEWDGLLVGPGMQEMKACLCEIPVRKMLANRKSIYKPVSSSSERR